MNTYGSIELDGIFSDHCSYAFIWSIAAVIARCHCASVFAPALFHRDDTMGHIKFEITAWGRVNDYHDGDTLGMEITDQTGALIWVLGIELDQMSSLADFTLDRIG